MWDHNLGVEEVYRLSLGCGQESGNILRWFDLRNKVDMTEDEKVQVKFSFLKGDGCYPNFH